MGHQPRQLDFVEKPFETARVLLQPRRKELERNRLPELQIIGAVDLPHASTSQKPHDTVALGKHAPWNKAALLRIGGLRAEVG